MVAQVAGEKQRKTSALGFGEMMRLHPAVGVLEKAVLARSSTRFSYFISAANGAGQRRLLLREPSE
jgi:hypothetical protein